MDARKQKVLDVHIFCNVQTPIWECFQNILRFKTRPSRSVTKTKMCQFQHTSSSSSTCWHCKFFAPDITAPRSANLENLELSIYCRFWREKGEVRTSKLSKQCDRIEYKLQWQIISICKDVYIWQYQATSVIVAKILLRHSTFLAKTKKKKGGGGSFSIIQVLAFEDHDKWPTNGANKIRALFYFSYSEAITNSIWNRLS